MKKYEPPDITEYGAVEQITESGETNKVGSSTDEYSGLTGLTGSDPTQ
jgi:hypothetical protein